MDFGSDTQRQTSEPFVPMINVVFLLLIFFLMTAQITPPPPFETEPPSAISDLSPSSQIVLHISPEGVFGFADQAGDDALAAALNAAADQPLRLKADGRMEGAVFAKTLSRLSGAGVTSVELTTTTRPAETAI